MVVVVVCPSGWGQDVVVLVPVVVHSVVVGAVVQWSGVVPVVLLVFVLVVVVD